MDVQKWHGENGPTSDARNNAGPSMSQGGTLTNTLLEPKIFSHKGKPGMPSLNQTCNSFGGGVGGSKCSFFFGGDVI